MRVQLTIRRLTVAGVAVHSRTALTRALEASITAQLEDALSRGGLPSAWQVSQTLGRLRGPAVTLDAGMAAGPGRDARLGRAVAQRFCTSLAGHAVAHTPLGTGTPTEPGPNAHGRTE